MSFVNFGNSYFNRLSNEVIIYILQNIEPFDLFQFCAAYNIDDFLQVSALIKNLDLCREYRLKDFRTINERVKLAYIIKLNINGIYWIRAYDLRNLLSKLTNLEILLAIDTTLDLKEDDFRIYSRLKLKKLAITVRETCISTRYPLITIETLLIKLLANVQIPWKLFPALVSLWCEDSANIVCGSMNTKVKKLLAKTEAMPTEDIRLYHYLTFRPSQMPTLFFDLVRLNKIDENSWPEEWIRLGSLRAEYPFPYRILYTLKEKNIGEIMFDELNFHHEGRLCLLCSKIYKRFLSSPCTKQLKKLSINLCLLTCDRPENPKASDESALKKRRLGFDDEQCPFFETHILYNCKSLEFLELYLCDEIVESELSHTLPVLCHLKQLKYLDIEIPSFNNGKFLIDVVNNCQQLETLKVNSLRPNDELNLHLCKALTNAPNLKHFRLKTMYIPIVEFLNVFCAIRKPRLQRISLICHEIDETDSNLYRILERFLQSNPQLIFIDFRFNNCALNVFESMNAILFKFQQQDPTRFYLITEPSMVDQYNLAIPNMHFEEMVCSRSIIAEPDAYEDFNDF